VTPAELEEELLSVAVQAARSAAVELEQRLGVSDGEISTKSTHTDLVSEADVEAEKAIRAVLSARRPGDAVLGEEGGATGAGELRWVIDPLDGTVNFLFGVPQFAVSVACEDADGGIVGVVLDPARGECFTAGRSVHPPAMNEVVIAASRRDDLSTALVATGFGYDAEVRSRQAAVLTRVLPRVRDIRRAGAAALDLAWCACGRYDAYYERGVKPWDVAAGALLAARAGLEVRVLPADGEDPEGLLVAPPKIVDELWTLVAGS
jgi:myo-inositol-1(or 4)-monophosphatase